MKIYAGTKTGVEYLWGIAHELKCEYEIKKQCGNIHANARAELDGRAQNQTYLNKLAELILGKGKFCTGFMAVTNHNTYYSDTLSKIIIQLTGSNLSNGCQQIADACGVEKPYIYQVALGSRPLTPKVASAISKATNSLVLCCLAEKEVCFGPGINFTPDSDWEIVFHDEVKAEVYKQASAPSESEDSEEDDYFIDDEDVQVNEDQQTVEAVQQNLGTNELDLFEKLSPSMKKLVLEYARTRAHCDTMSNEQIVLGYCIQNSGDKSIQDLIRTVSK